MIINLDKIFTFVLTLHENIVFRCLKNCLLGYTWRGKMDSIMVFGDQISKTTDPDVTEDVRFQHRIF